MQKKKIIIEMHKKFVPFIACFPLFHSEAETLCICAVVGFAFIRNLKTEWSISHVLYSKWCNAFPPHKSSSSLYELNYI